MRITSPPVLTWVAIVCDADQTSISGAVKGVLAVPKVGVSNGLREVVVTLRDVTQLPLDAFCECRVNFLIVGGGHRYLDTWIPKICQVSKKKVSNSIQEYPKVSIVVSFFVDQSHPLNQLSTSSLEF